MKRHNIHIHSTFSDGRLSIEEIAVRATGLEVIGISDHAYTTKLPSSLQVNGKLDAYIAELEKVQHLHPEIKILKGLEIDSHRYSGTNPLGLPFDQVNRFDYVLFEQVSLGTFGDRSIYDLIEARPYLHCAVGLAHNDMQINFDSHEREVAKLLTELDIFVDINQSEIGAEGIGGNTRLGLDYFHYFSPELLGAMREYGVKVAIGTDAHAGQSILLIDEAYHFIEQHHLLPHPLIQ